MLDYLERPDVGLVFEADAHPSYANHGKPPTLLWAGHAQGNGCNDEQQTESKTENSSVPEAGQFQATRLIITGKTYEFIIQFIEPFHRICCAGLVVHNDQAHSRRANDAGYANSQDDPRRVQPDGSPRPFSLLVACWSPSGGSADVTFLANPPRRLAVQTDLKEVIILVINGSLLCHY